MGSRERIFLGDSRDEPREVRTIGKCLQMSAGRFLARHMMDVSSRDAKTAVFRGEAAGAGTARLDGGEVVCVGAVAEVDVAGGDDSVAETLRIGATVRNLVHLEFLWWTGRGSCLT